jgi:Zn-dependent M16 (insulinase) family peptidase
MICIVLGKWEVNMNFIINETYNGFKVINKEYIEEIECQGIYFEHIKSGALLYKLESPNDNRVFSIGFRTPPESSNGLTHILEHCTLSGSGKYKTKEPFVDLLKGSLNTFLNAITYPDKTLYPLSSRNPKDFYNLMDVYLDGVFYPAIYHQREIFMQEGWHYELDSPEGDISYKGIVYNEMKGAYSAPEELLGIKVRDKLFPDTPYRYESGGDPDMIPQLTQEEFLKFHETYYHPSNSYIYLYGNGNTMEELRYLDDNYLSHFERRTIASGIPLQQPFSERRDYTEEYSVLTDEETENSTYLSLSFVTGKKTDTRELLGLDILQHMLIETPASPLKLALTNAALGEDVDGDFDTYMLQPVISIIIKNSEPDKKDKFLNVTKETLKRLCIEGLDRELIDASINLLEFKLRESEKEHASKGLLYAIRCMDGWLYGQDPGEHLKYTRLLKEIRELSHKGYFEELIKKYFLNNTHSVFISLEPHPGLGEEKEKQLKEHLRKFKEGLSKEQLKGIIEDTRRLKQRQLEDDTPEQKATIPVLSLEDIDSSPEWVDTRVEELAGAKVLYHPMESNGIVYINLYLDMGGLREELLPYAALLSDILGEVDTKSCSYVDLAKKISCTIGDLEFNVQEYDINDENNSVDTRFTICIRVLEEKLPEALGIIGEICSGSLFDNKKRLRELLKEIKCDFEEDLYDDGDEIASERLTSYFSKGGVIREAIGGVKYYKFISSLEEEFDEKSGELAEKLKETYEIVMSQKNLIIGVLGSDREYNSFKENAGLLLKHIPVKAFQKHIWSLKLKSLNEGLLTSGEVQYVSKGCSIKKIGYSYTGKLQVLQTILKLDYLWNHVRAKGGAYGCSVKFYKNGDVIFSSYRDPNLKETLKVYDECGSYLRNFKANDKEMAKYIVGTIGEMDALLTTWEKAQLYDELYIRNISREDVQKERDEILAVKAEDIRSFAGLMDHIAGENNLCVLGNENEIKRNKELFRKLLNVLE